MTGNPAAKKREKERARKERQAEKDLKRKERRNNPGSPDEATSEEESVTPLEPTPEIDIPPTPKGDSPAAGATTSS